MKKLTSILNNDEVKVTIIAALILISAISLFLYCIPANELQLLLNY